MADKCAICGAEINLFQTQKLADGNCICRKGCVKKGFKVFDYVHATLPQVEAHISQVERGTKLWEHYFVPKMKEKSKDKKPKVLPSNFYVAADLGLMAYVQNDYKFFVFGKSTRACVYRIADLRDYDYEVQEKKTDNGVEKKEFVRVSFINTEGLNEFSVPISGTGYKTFSKYFNELFGIQKTLGNMKNTWKNQVDAAKSVAEGFKSVLSGDEDATDKAAQAGAALDKMQYGDRTELIRRADEALAAFDA